MSGYQTNNNTIMMEKAISSDVSVNNELIKDCIALTGVFERNLKYMPIIDTILDNLEPNTNMYLGTYEKVSTELGISYSTVVRTFKSLIDHGIIERVSKGVYKLNSTLMQTPVEALQVKYVRKENTDDSQHHK